MNSDGRTARKTRIAIVMLALALAACAVALSGCSKKAPETSAAPPAAPAAAVRTASGGSDQTEVSVADRSANVPETFVPFPKGEFVPVALKTRVAEKRPTLIYFFDSDQKASDEVRDAIDDVLDDNRGLVGLVAYDIGRYVSYDPAAGVTADADLASNRDAAHTVQLARELGVTETPFIVLTDSQGMVVYRHRGLEDPDFLEREIQRASR